MTETQTSAFQRSQKQFTLMGKTFIYKHIPSVHLKAVLNQIFDTWLILNTSEKTETFGAEKKSPESCLLILKELIYKDIEQILTDILYHHNGQTVITREDFDYHVSLPELLNFFNLVLADEEIAPALEEMIKLLGKYGIKLGQKNPFPIPNSTPSSSLNSEETPTT